MPTPYLMDKGIYSGAVTGRSKTDNVIISKTQYDIGQDEAGLHYHENPHISFVFQGKDVEKRNNISYGRKAGDIFFYEAGEAHQTVLRTQSSQNLNIELENDFFIENEITTQQLAQSIANNMDAKFLALNILKELDQQDENTATTIHLLLLELISNCKMDSGLVSPKWIENLSDLLNDRWDEQITLNELAANISVHPVTISKCFRRYFHTTYGAYMRKLKINKSIPLIKHTNASLTEIAFQCGFTDQSHFIKNFKSFTGFLPKDFRKL